MGEGDTSVGFTISGRGILRTFANLALDRVAKVTNRGISRAGVIPGPGDSCDG